jgi:hypothetical protein
MLGGAGNGAELLVEGAEAAVWRELAARRTAHNGSSVAFAGTLPSHLPAAGEALVTAADACGVDVLLASHSALGLHTAHFAGQPEAQARAFDQWRRSVLDMGGTVLLRDRPEELDSHVDALGPPPSTAKLMRALKSQLDPGGRLATGRLGTWL